MLGGRAVKWFARGGNVVLGGRVVKWFVRGGGGQ